jgi:hypothetical protein
MKAGVGVVKFCFCVVVVFLFALVGPNLSAQSQPCQVSGKICVLTWQQDTASETCAGCVYRTGENLSESAVTYSSIQTDNFQKAGWPRCLIF